MATLEDSKIHVGSSLIKPFILHGNLDVLLISPHMNLVSL